MYGQNILRQYNHKILCDEKYLQIVDENYPILAYASSVGEIGLIKESFYRSGDNGAFQGLFPKKRKYSLKELQFILTSAKILFNNFNYGTSMADVINLKIILPITSTGEIDFVFMESFIRELEEERIHELEDMRTRELTAYLTVSGLSDTKLSDSEEAVLLQFESLEWAEFNLEHLFGKSTRGKRLKGKDRIQGNLPFVTAGETNEGISAFISNEVEIFSKNTTTIDMFGSAKYRNYDYGADDHVAVVHTEKLSKHAAIFVTTACHKAAHTGKFSYSRNFYAKDANELFISLPVKDGDPDYETMELFISAIQKLVIKDVVQYADQKIAATKLVTNNE